MTKKKSKIEIEISLGEDRIPEMIEWTALDSAKEAQEAKAMLLSFFDKENRETLKIDLWTREMQVVEMDRFMYHTLRGLSDAYFRATNNQKVAGAMQQFVQFFGEETEIIPREK